LGCVGDLSPNAGGDDDNTGSGSSNVARQIFDQKVYSIVKNKCSGCHLSTGPVGNVTGFVSPTVDNAHETIVGYQAVRGNFTTATAGVLLKIQAAGGHHGVSVYTTDEVSKITEWLDAEVANQMGGSGTTTTGGETPAAATARVMGAWSACMDKTLFDQAQMSQAWGNMTASNNQRCEGCHATGAEGFMATTDSQFMFDTISSNKYYMLQYFSVSGLDNPATAKMVINQTSFMGVSQGQDPHREHPRFNATDNAGMTALTKFYGAVDMARIAAGTAGCGPSKLTN
jgi:hypothetical protein